MQTEIAKHQSIIARCDNPEIKSSWEIDLQEQETDLQNFKVFNAMGESAPQFILALSILMKKGALHSWMYQLCFELLWDLSVLEAARQDPGAEFPGLFHFNYCPMYHGQFLFRVLHSDFLTQYGFSYVSAINCFPHFHR